MWKIFLCTCLEIEDCFCRSNRNPRPIIAGSPTAFMRCRVISCNPPWMFWFVSLLMACTLLCPASSPVREPRLSTEVRRTSHTVRGLTILRLRGGKLPRPKKRGEFATWGEKASSRHEFVEVSLFHDMHIVTRENRWHMRKKIQLICSNQQLCARILAFCYFDEKSSRKWRKIKGKKQLWKINHILGISDRAHTRFITTGFWQSKTTICCRMRERADPYRKMVQTHGLSVGSRTTRTTSLRRSRTTA